ncbi:MAG: glycoside hydrolase N-terminal domain-containing protein, partial [Verrucomicrobiae bacterium]|nr:glycoside hydrolase N-terminal domain-containing protein [Verrucomicrobiae bacterium]
MSAGLLQAQPEAFDPAATLWYDTGVQDWREAMPMGNGRLGAMYFGGVKEDRLQFNEDTYWTGGPYDSVPKGAYQHLDEVRRLLFADRLVEGHLLFGRHFLGHPVEQQKYQCMGNLVLDFPSDEGVSCFRRSLDLRTGISRVVYRQNGVSHLREVFVSEPDQAIVMRIAADQPRAVSFNCQLRGVRNQAHSNYATDYFHMDLWRENGLILTGKSADYLGVEGKLRYEARLLARVKGGKVSTDVRSLRIEGADEVVLLLVAATNFKSCKDVSGNCATRVQACLDRLEGRDYERIKQDHVKDHRALFNRVTLDLPVGRNSFLPTDVRLKKVEEAPDPALAALAFQFSRYLMMGSSRAGTQPANLQGIWNDEANPKWDSKYTLNINLQMNYWSVDSSNLGECAQPLFDLIRDLPDQGRRTARELYGAKHGWVCHQNTDLWRQTTPMDGSNWGGFTTAGAWLCTHLWEHYQYTGDKAFLQRNYPVMKGAAEFFLHFLVPQPRDGCLVTCPATSPENTPRTPGNQPFFDEMNGASYRGSQMNYGTAIDTQILMDLFDQVARAAEVLDVDPTFRRQVLEARAQLPPMKVGAEGLLQEWYEDWRSVEPQHRHLSPVYGLYPGHVLSPVKTPQLMGAVRNVLNSRGDASSGWSRAWKVCLWARLLEGDRAERILNGYFSNQCFNSLFSNCSDAMQVDGSFGVGAGITEMLMQSHEGYLELLPALPQNWAKGRFCGVVARGAFELDYTWENGKLNHIV